MKSELQLRAWQCVLEFMRTAVTVRNVEVLKWCLYGRLGRYEMWLERGNSSFDVVQMRQAEAGAGAD